MALRSYALLGVVLLLCVSLSCASRFLEDGEDHVDDHRIGGKDVPWNSGDGIAGAGFGMGRGEGGDGSSPAPGIADHGIGAGEGYEHGKGYTSGPEGGDGLCDSGPNGVPCYDGGGGNGYMTEAEAMVTCQEMEDTLEPAVVTCQEVEDTLVPAVVTCQEVEDTLVPVVAAVARPTSPTPCRFSAVHCPVPGFLIREPK